MESRAVENQHATTPWPADLELLAVREQPDLFQSLVDSLPPGPARVGLRLWGVLHGVYTLSEQAKAEMHQQVLQFPTVGNSGPAVDSR